MTLIKSFILEADIFLHLNSAVTIIININSIVCRTANKDQTPVVLLLFNSTARQTILSSVKNPSWQGMQPSSDAMVFPTQELHAVSLSLETVPGGHISQKVLLTSVENFPAEQGTHLDVFQLNSSPMPHLGKS